MQERLLPESREIPAPAADAEAAAPDWITELLQAAPAPTGGGGAWEGVIAQVREQTGGGEEQRPAFDLPPGVRIVADASGQLRVWPGMAADAVSARLAAAGMSLEDLRPMAEQVEKAPAPQQQQAPEQMAPEQQSPEGGGGGRRPAPANVSARGAADLDRLANAARSPWYSSPKGKCYKAVAGFDSNSYMNKAGGRWKQLADRIPGDHGMWAVSFAHWLQETRHGRQAAAELGFTILESDGRTRLGDFLAARPDLRGAIVVTPFGQEGTASQEWNAAANYGNKKWGAGVGDISVVTEIGAKGAVHVADGPVRHNNATMWWIVHPK